MLSFDPEQTDPGGEYIRHFVSELAKVKGAGALAGFTLT